MPFLPRRRAGLCALAAACLIAAAPTAAAAATYEFSPVNQYGIQDTAAYWNPIIDYVSQKSGVKLKLKIGRTSADTTAYVLAKEVDFVFTNHLFSPEREKLGWKVFGRRMTPPVRGQIVVPAESPITHLAELGGRDVAFPGPEATIAYKFTYAELLARKVEVNTVFAGNHDAAFVQLLSGKADAVGANSQLVEGYEKREGHKFKVLWSSPPLHDLALMHSARVPAADVKAVAQAFNTMHLDPRGREILEASAKVAGQAAAGHHFEASDGSEYGAYRAFYKSAPAQLR